MPTGYTAAVQDGTITEFKDYALQCARAFGACVMQRDDDPSEPPKEQEESSYYRERVDETLKEIEVLGNLSDEELVESEKNANLREIDECKQRLEDKKIERLRYDDMLKKVRAWEAPSEEHLDYKEFMTNQLVESIGFDCGDNYYEDNLQNAVFKFENTPTAKEIREERMADLQRDLEYYRKNLAEEKDRVFGRNQWIRQLYKSLENGSKL
jgi:hypothetical protein